MVANPLQFASKEKSHLKPQCGFTEELTIPGIAKINNLNALSEAKIQRQLTRNG